MYKEPKKFKGFETWFHTVQMTFKMHFYSFVLLLILHVSVPFFYLLFFDKQTIKLVFEVFSGFYVQYFDESLRLLFKKGVVIFILSSIVWLLYPVLLNFYKSRATRIMQDQHMRGSKLISDDELRNQIQKEEKEFRFAIGKVPVPTSIEPRHFFIVGRPGTGKTTLLNGVLKKIREMDGKAIIHDFKGDYVSYFFNPKSDILFNPLDVRTAHWSLFDEIEMIPDIDSLANSLIPISFKEDKFWTDAARDVFSSILHYLTISNKKTNADLWDCVTLTEAEMVQLVQIATAQGIEAAKKAQGYLQGYDKGSKVASDVLSTMRQYTNCFYYTRHIQNNFSIKKWLESEQGGFVFITNYQNIRDTLRPVLSLFLDTTMKHLLSLSESYERRVFFILDEFASLQQLSSIIRTLEQGRSKGASVWIATQDIAQMQKLYGHETTHTIANNCNTITAFAVNDPQSQEYLSKLFGETEILETDETLSMGSVDIRDGINITRRRKVEKLILASQFGSLKDFECYTKLGSSITKTKIDFTKQQKVQNQALMLDPRFKF